MEREQKRRKTLSIDIPTDLVAVVLDYVGVKDHAAFMLVCKEWRKIFLDSHLSLKHRFITELRTIGLKSPKNGYRRIQIPAIRAYLGQKERMFAIPTSERTATILYENGDYYIGEVRHEARYGIGIYYHSNGARYEGEFRNGHKNGKGVYYYLDGGSYDGEYRNGHKNGKGVDYHLDGSRYEGEYRNDKANGKGILYYPSGDRYEGEYKNGKRDGHGSMYFPDGSSVNQFYVDGAIVDKKL